MEDKQKYYRKSHKDKGTNIPSTVCSGSDRNCESCEMPMEFLDSHCLLGNEKAELQNSDSTKETIASAFDFLYLPFDSDPGRDDSRAMVKQRTVASRTGPGKARVNVLPQNMLIVVSRGSWFRRPWKG
ncbi:hypothetical protein SADUNF_Sadunf09G0100300 [Salix dunnii]|uniref:Uncharacterized protein n=1 Tax=Salix dunnii TaxID=1413687 RepID=A0A835MWJ6_9ROSI|nr:hypothetical protein SADUNF_Sadunf09G0100300 [Salix dunnii]